MKKIHYRLLLTLMVFPLSLHAAENTVEVFVSIDPQKFFVEQIGGNYVHVSVMVEPGHSPATYEPTPQKMVHLAQAALYFRIGVPFEQAWMDRIQRINPNLKVVDVRENVPLRRMETHAHGNEEVLPQDDNDFHGTKDPHCWLNPRYVKILAKTILKTLATWKPAYRRHFEQNYQSFIKKLDRLDQEIEDMFRDVNKRTFLVFHPSWGYFADAYHLRQIPIEREGKEPTTKQLVELMQVAKQENVRTIFIQPQFDVRVAQRIAQSIQGSVETIDPLAYDYFKNMRIVAKKIRAALQ